MDGIIFLPNFFGIGGFSGDFLLFLGCPFNIFPVFFVVNTCCFLPIKKKIFFYQIVEGPHACTLFASRSHYYGICHLEWS